eukprot:CAMPEP_0184398174 /NCGR_PEP_ID=MMETSP0007-20130409/64444_1 /TAXON_ID=97485 /ORGANISM="Prymnesium parvum, Strain Texoma1" /LENGTH=135 /DNA_ID=CAMNT_0026751983 /DNA_START=196 /DNA_END=601 /DNA_ORIENTATION=+
MKTPLIAFQWLGFQVVIKRDGCIPFWSYGNTKSREGCVPACILLGQRVEVDQNRHTPLSSPKELVNVACIKKNRCAPRTAAQADTARIGAARCSPPGNPKLRLAAADSREGWVAVVRQVRRRGRADSSPVRCDGR